jgi:hypothetical protein
MNDYKSTNNSLPESNELTPQPPLFFLERRSNVLNISYFPPLYEVERGMKWGEYIVLRTLLSSPPCCFSGTV